MKYIFNYNFIVIDTCSLLENESPFMCNYIIDYFKNNKPDKCHIVILEAVISELKKHIKLNTRGLGNKCENVLKLIESNKNIFEIAGNDVYGFGDISIFRAVTGLRKVGTVLLISEDKNLTHDCILLNQLLSQRGKRIDAMRVRDVCGR